MYATARGRYQYACFIIYNNTAIKQDIASGKGQAAAVIVSRIAMDQHIPEDHISGLGKVSAAAPAGRVIIDL